MTSAVIGEWTTADKSTWGPGPWQGEPDKVHWIDPATDLDCLIVRGPSGALCGYVAVTEGHPAFDKSYDDLDIEVHGGLTFAGPCMDTDDPGRYVCHVAQPGRPDHVYWLGFDCAHAWDISPAIDARYRESGNPWPRGPHDTYRDRAYVEGEVRSLARQLRAMA